MELDLSNAANGARRFIEYATSEGYAPHPIGLTERNKDIQPTTLVYGTDAITHFLVFRRKEALPRNVIRDLIESEDLTKAYRIGGGRIKGEMISGRMGPFVSEVFEDFRVWLDYLTFQGNRHLAFYLGNNGKEGFCLSANVFRKLLTGLYGEERVKIFYLFQ